MNKSINISALVLIAGLFASCSGGSGSHQDGISGNIKGAEEGQTIYLERFLNMRPVTTDSAKLDANGNFSFVPNPPLELNYYRLSFSGQNALVLLTDSTENVFVNADASNLMGTYSVEGSKHTSLLLDLNNSLKQNREAISSKVELFKQASSKEEKAQLKSEVLEEQKTIKDKCIEFISNHSDSPVTLTALSDLNIKTEQQHYDAVLSATRDNFGHSYYYKAIAQQVAAEKQKGSASAQQASSNNKFMEGMTAPNISMNNPEGKTVSLESLRGNVVLIDFWASWCGPCRRENPHVVHSYEKYNKDGFEVFSVSLDRQVDRWKQAIEQDGLIWPNHVSDLKGWQSDAAALYGIHSIPHTILIDREGQIIGTHLRGQALTAKLQEIFGH